LYFNNLKLFNIHDFICVLSTILIKQAHERECRFAQRSTQDCGTQHDDTALYAELEHLRARVRELSVIHDRLFHIEANLQRRPCQCTGSHGPATERRQSDPIIRIDRAMQSDSTASKSISTATAGPAGPTSAPIPASSIGFGSTGTPPLIRNGSVDAGSKPSLIRFGSPLNESTAPSSTIRWGSAPDETRQNGTMTFITRGQQRFMIRNVPLTISVLELKRLVRRDVPGAAATDQEMALVLRKGGYDYVLLEDTKLLMRYDLLLRDNTEILVVPGVHASTRACGLIRGLKE
jgi:hypothetical protein